MVAYSYRMPSGIPGECTRISASIIETQIVTPTGTTGAPTAYGVPMVVDNTGGNVGNMRTLNSGDTTIYGALVRPFPTGAAPQSGQLNSSGIGTSTPPANGPCDILRFGYMNVLLSGTTAAVKGGQVYVWTAAASGAHIVGGWEAANPSGSGISIPQAFFIGPADANAITEISLGGLGA
jgi:hypothetical protein